MKCATVNIRSGKETDEGERLYQLIKEISRGNLDIVGFQEVRYLGKGNHVINLPNGDSYKLYYSGEMENRSNGVGIVVKNDARIECDEPDFNSSRVIASNMKIVNVPIRVISCYAPTEVTLETEKRTCFIMIWKKLSK